MHRIAEVDFAGHIEFNVKIIAVGAAISSYYSANARPAIPYWPLGFADTTLRLLGSDGFIPEVKADAAAELTAALLDGGPATRRRSSNGPAASWTRRPPLPGRAA